MEQQIGVQQVLDTIRTALNPVSPQRAQAEATLATWEADAAPGFAISLIRIVEESGSIDEVRAGRSSGPCGC